MSVEGETVNGPRELARRIAAFAPKKIVSLALTRDGKAQNVQVTLGAMPSDATVAKAPAPAPTAEDNAVGKLGLELEAASGGVKVVSVEPDSPAAQRGIEQGDVIVAAGGKDVGQPADVATALAEAKSAGRKAVLLRVKTDQSVRFVALPVNKAS